MHTKTENDDGREKVFFWKNGAAIRHPLLPWGGGHFMVCAEFDIINILCSALVANLPPVKFYFLPRQSYGNSKFNLLMQRTRSRCPHLHRSADSVRVWNIPVDLGGFA
jgi:hypothetical protein